MTLHRNTRKTTSRTTSEATKNLMHTACPGQLGMDEAALRKLTRAELQKLAKEHNVKANAKSNLIIETLMKLCKVVPLHQDEDEEPVRKKSRTSLHDQTDPMSPRRERDGREPPPAQNMDVPMDGNLNHVTVVEDSPGSVAIPQHTTPIIAARNVGDNAGGHSAGMSQDPSALPESHPVPKGDINHSGSDLSYTNKNGLYYSPVSSRAGTPPLEESRMLERAVKIMNQVTADDQRILAQIAALRERAAMLQEQAQNARDVVRAERGRRVRLEAYFTYWRDTTPEWPKEWIYEAGEEERIRTERALRNLPPSMPSTGPSGPSTLPVEERDVSTWAAHMSLRRRQLQQRREAYKKGTVAAPISAVVDQIGEHASLPSPQSSSSQRAAKRKSCS